MSEPSYQVIFRGKILTGFDRDQVRRNLAQLFKTDPTRIDTLLDAPKTVLKAGIGKDAAARYQDVLRQAGIMVAVMADAPAASASAPAPVPAPNQTPPVAATGTSAPVAPVPAVTRQITPVAAPVARSGALSLAAAGERIIPAHQRVAPSINTSALRLSTSSTPLDTSPKPQAPSFDLSQFQVVVDSSPIDNSPRPKALDVDISALSLTERPAEVETGMTELQKLLSSE